MNSSIGPTPRRVQLDLLTKEELMIKDCIKAVEALGRDERLTNTIINLMGASSNLADYVDNVPVKETTFMERLLDEADELHDKMAKLYNFISKPEAKAKVGTVQYNFLQAQYAAMTAYHTILIARVEDLRLDNEVETA
jgi:hypothetical protein